MQNPITIPTPKLAAGLLEARQSKNLPEPLMQAYERIESALDLDEYIAEATHEGASLGAAINEAIQDFLQGDLNLDAVQHPAIGNLDLQIDSQGVAITYAGDLDAVIKTLNQVADHVMACYDDDEGINPDWANPWAIGIASGSDDTDYLGSYPQIIGDMLLIYSLR